MEELEQRGKYYTPDISEFHVGFECESFNDYSKSWLSVEIGYEHYYCDELGPEEDYIFTEHYGKPLNFRVKYLDTEDLKELGWDVYQLNDRDFSARLVGKKYHVDMYYHYPDHTAQIVYYWPKEVREGCKIDPYNLYNSEYLFSGVVKNKSELKRILEMIKINYND